MKSFIILVLCCLVFLCVHAGQQENTSNSCKCKNGYIAKGFKPRLIKSEPLFYEASVFCPKREIIITTIKDEIKCVDPESLLGKRLWDKHDKKMAERMTTSSQSDTSSQSTPSHSSTRRHTTTQTVN